MHDREQVHDDGHGEHRGARALGEPERRLDARAHTTDPVDWPVTAGP